MCGISGIYGIENLTDPRAAIEAMNSALAHRGPDASGVFLQDEICLGHRRLSVIDLESHSDQPFIDKRGRYTLVFNGEIYNYRNLRYLLKNWEFTTNSDTEVLLAAYDEWGLDCLEFLNGMFAFALWDSEKRTLVIARDRLGIKPLYISFQGESIFFASELRALLASGHVKPILDREVLPQYVQYQTVFGNRSIISGVEMLPAAHLIRIQDNEQEIIRYWSGPTTANVRPTTRETATKELREKLEQAVSRRLVADVPFGAFLSGGIDSSAIVALMSQSSDTQVSTFSVTFDESEFSEAKYAQLIADQYHTAHHEIRLTPQDFLDNLPLALDAMDHPSGDGPNSFIVSKETKKAGMTMALSGLGGDELFAGYGLFQHVHSMLDKKWLQQFPAFMRKGGASLLKTLKPDAQASKMASLLVLPWIDIFHVYPEMRKVLPDDVVRSLLNSKERRPSDDMRSYLRSLPEAWNTWPRTSQISWAEINTYMKDTLLRDTDQMSMAHALEVRVPFLDHDLVDYVLTLPDDFKSGSTTKSLLVEAMGELLPSEVVHRPKMGFTLPWEQWMKGPLRSFCEVHLLELGRRDVFISSRLDMMWKGFLSGDKRFGWSRIWHLVVLEYWLQKHHVSS